MTTTITSGPAMGQASDQQTQDYQARQDRRGHRGRGVVLAAGAASEALAEVGAELGGDLVALAVYQLLLAELRDSPDGEVRLCQKAWARRWRQGVAAIGGAVASLLASGRLVRVTHVTGRGLRTVYRVSPGRFTPGEIDQIRERYGPGARIEGADWLGLEPAGRPSRAGRAHRPAPVQASSPSRAQAARRRARRPVTAGPRGRARGRGGEFTGPTARPWRRTEPLVGQGTSFRAPQPGKGPDRGYEFPGPHKELTLSVKPPLPPLGAKEEAQTTTITGDTARVLSQLTAAWPGLAAELAGSPVKQGRLAGLLDQALTAKDPDWLTSALTRGTTGAHSAYGVLTSRLSEAMANPDGGRRAPLPPLCGHCDNRWITTTGPDDRPRLAPCPHCHPGHQDHPGRRGPKTTATPGTQPPPYQPDQTRPASRECAAAAIHQIRTLLRHPKENPS